jgi:regulator of protease activity HflC (stomatin/prohibitin superfamily)
MVWLVLGLILIAVSVTAFIIFRKAQKTLNTMRTENELAASRADQMDIRRGYHTDPHSTSRLRDQRFGVIAAGIVFGVTGALGLFTIVMDSFTVVASRNVGIPVTFGAVGNPYGPGPHWVAPWTDVTKVDATTQNINRNADEGQWANGNCTAVLVRLASGANACADITAQWNVSNNAPTASQLWTQYRGNTDDEDKTNDNFITNLTNNVVDREIQRAMNAAFANYNPIVVGNNNEAVNTPLDLAQYSRDVKGDLQKTVASGIDVTEFLVSHLHFDRVTQDKINALAQAKADTQIALQKKETARAQKEANDLLAASASSNDSGVMFQNCLNVLKDLASSGQLGNLPVNSLQCVIGGSGTPVIVSTNKSP